MEILVIIVAFWLILVGGYGAMTLLNGSPTRRSGRRPSQPAPRVRISPRFAQQSLPGAPENPQLGGLFSEVDLLRAQVEHLRTEVVALSDVAARHERPRTRRYRTGVYSDLPRLLRRQVKQARNVRHPLGV